MRSPSVALAVAVILALTLAANALAQTGRDAPKPVETRKSGEPPEAAPDDNQQEIETVKVNTNLVTVPVIASTRDGIYLSDLRKEEFSVYEDGVKQEVSFFATVSEPFHVVLLLDTSASTRYKLRQIQDAAVSFTEQLQTGDRVKVISFDTDVRDLCAFSNDRAVLRQAIKQTVPGEGTKLYDAMSLAMILLQPVKGRKAIVLFTDGVDWHSDTATYEENRRMLEESGIIVYPIRYNTRAETELLARQQTESGQAVDLGAIFGGQRTSRGTTPPTFPTDNTSTIPQTSGRGGNTSRIPSPSVIFGPTRTDPRGGRGDEPRAPEDVGAADRDSIRRDKDGISRVLDMAYKLADDYLNEMAEKSGGRLLRADNLYSLPEAFAEIAAELRTQYSLGYYPTNPVRDDKYRKIQVKTSRKDVAVRARPGYRVQSGEVKARKR